jgi:hypothetical protein
VFGDGAPAADASSQGTVRPGASLPLATSYTDFNQSSIFTITVYLSQGVTSRGRLGITSNLYMQTITEPWLQDPVDKAVLMNALTDVINQAKTGEHAPCVEGTAAEADACGSERAPPDRAGQHDDARELRQHVPGQLAQLEPLGRLEPDRWCRRHEPEGYRHQQPGGSRFPRRAELG